MSQASFPAAPARLKDTPDLWLDLLAPIAPNRPFLDRFVLLGAQHPRGNSTLVYTFRDLRMALDFELRFIWRDSPGAALGRPFAQAGPFDLALNSPSPIADAQADLVGAVARLFVRNLKNPRFAGLADFFTNGGRRHTPLDDYNAIPFSKRLDMLVGHVCNSRCVFCSDTTCRDHTKAHSFEEWAALLEKARRDGYESVTFVGMEPTLRRDMPELIAHAKFVGFRDIQLSTNGTRLANPAYAERLVSAGLTVITISLHAPDAESEGLLTGRPAHFAQRMQALHNLRALLGDRDEQSRRGVFLRVSAVLTRPTLALMPALADLLIPFDPTSIPLNYPWIVGGAKARYAELIPDYASVMSALAPLKARLSDPDDALELVNVPPCTARGLNLGGMTEKVIVQATKELRPEHQIAQTDAQAGAVPFSLSLMDPSKVYAPLCATCLARPHCDGVAALYLAHYGSLGLAPILDPAALERLAPIAPRMSK